MSTWNGITIVSIPTGIANVLSIDWDPQEIVASTTDTFTGQQQTFDWQASYWQGTLSFPPMTRSDGDTWAAFILSLRGPLNAFLFGNPKAAQPKGSPAGAPVVNGAGQGVFGTGINLYQVNTRGWTPSRSNLLQVGDYISIYPRLYRVTAPVASDASGHATISIWPNLRDAPADGTAITTSNCAGLFRLAQAKGNSFSTSLKGYGLTGIKIRDAI